MVVVWRVTEQCNLGCRFCAYDVALRRSRRVADIAEIRAFGQVLGEYGKTTGQEVLIVWHGGEPLLWQPLTELSTSFRRDHGIRIATTTNGTLLSVAAIREHLVRVYDELTVSVDAIGEVYDRLRHWPGGFSVLRRNVRHLAAETQRSGSNLRLRANIVLMRDTIGEFGKLCRELSEWGIREVTFNQLGGNDRPEFYPHHRLLPEQVDRFADELPDLRRELAALGLQVLGSDSYLERFRATARNRRLAVEKCDTARRFLFIDEGGMAAPCSFSVSELGLSVRTIPSVAALEELISMLIEVQHRQPPAACADCHSTQLFQKFREG